MNEVANQLSKGVKGEWKGLFVSGMYVCRVLCWLVGWSVSKGEERRKEKWGERKKKEPSPLFVGETKNKKFAQVEEKRNLRFFSRLKVTGQWTPQLRHRSVQLQRLLYLHSTMYLLIHTGYGRKKS